MESRAGFRWLWSIVNHSQRHYPGNYSCCFPFDSYGYYWKCQRRIRISICLGFQTCPTHTAAVNWLTNRIPFITNDDVRHIIENHLINIIRYEWYMAGKSIKTVAHVWNPKHVQLISQQLNWLANHMPFITNDILR